MRSTLSALLALISFWGIFPVSLAAQDMDGDLAVWLEQFRAEARAAGISQQTLELALSDLHSPLPEVIKRDRSQPELVQSLPDYLSARVSDKRIAEGQKMLRKYPTWLGRVERKYGVQRRFIVALWGIETNYGEHLGGFPVVQSLVTLAFEGRRGDYFRRELLETLRILEEDRIPLERMRGSWAGAMGQCQFMPSSYRRFAVDADEDGRRDIWTSVPDVLGSAANYLARQGWQDDQTWGRPVRLPQGFDTTRSGLELRLSLRDWQALGVRRSNGRDLPRRNLQASLILPDGSAGPAYLVYDNFRRILSWNRSLAFAVAVGTLSDRFEESR